MEVYKSMIKANGYELKKFSVAKFIGNAEKYRAYFEVLGNVWRQNRMFMFYADDVDTYRFYSKDEELGIPPHVATFLRFDAHGNGCVMAIDLDDPMYLQSISNWIRNNTMPDEICCICLEQWCVETTPPIICPRCNAAMHKRCAMTHFMKCQKCPKCRYNILH